jgi:hypothetical protein
VERQVGVMKEKAIRSLPVQDSLTPMKQNGPSRVFIPAYGDVERR